jgi:nitrite reductase/ring-hydroxylating ferredoxin subunit
MRTTTHPSGLVPVAPLAELEAKGVIVVAGADRPIAVFWHQGRVRAVDNRCPHLGFPLHKGSLRDGLLTCHWHEARFDLCTGCTFDLWADDVPAFDAVVEDGFVYVAPQPRHKPGRGDYLRRLTQGLEQEVSLVQAKSILGLRSTGAEWTEVLRAIARFGSRHQENWGEGMTLLALAGNLLPRLSPETAYHVVFRACRQVGIDCSGAAARRAGDPLAGGAHPPEQLARWMRTWIRTRHRDAAERVLLTAISSTRGEGEIRDASSTRNPTRGTSPPFPEQVDLVFTAACDRVYAQIGHVLDAWNKAFELLEVIGWEQAAEILPLVIPMTASARGAEEDAHWHHPHELVEPLRAAEAELPEILAAGRIHTSTVPADLLPILLGEDPLAIIDACFKALRGGLPPVELSKHVTYAAAVRLARFSENNEVADWFNPRHTFIFANAVHQTVKRSASSGVVRGILHAALAVYMDRFLNVPPARLADDPQRLDALPGDAGGLRERLLTTLDQQSNLDEAALTVVRYVRLGHPLDGLIDTLSLAIAREDLDFHALQVLEAGVQQCCEWNGGPECEPILIGIVRQFAAVCPTPRAAHRTAVTALRLDRGDRMYED